MDKQDYISLIEVTDDYEQLDLTLKKITGVGHGSGIYSNLDNIYDVLLRNSHPSYSENDEAESLFYTILSDSNRTANDRADILINGFIQCNNAKKNDYTS